MSDKLKKIAPQILKEIQKAERILLHLHRAPDGDSIGSALGMYHVLKKMDKDVTIIEGDTPKPHSFSVLKGFEIIEKKSFFDIDTLLFDLFIVLDSASLEMISSKGDVIFPKNMRVVVIDHHGTNQGFGDINWIDEKYAATAQMLVGLFIAWGITISKDAADALFLGLYTDTGGFKYPKTSFDTLQAAAECAKQSDNFSDVVRKVENTKTPGEVAFMGLAYQNVEVYYEGRVALVSITRAMIQEKNITQDDVAKAQIVDFLKQVPQWRIVALLVEKEDALTQISIRTESEDVLNVSKIALKLGGGGHPGAAGAMVKKSLLEAKKDLLDAIEQVVPNTSSL